MSFSDLISLLVTATLETIYMTLLATFFAYLLGLPLGFFLTVTSKNGIMPMPKLNKIVSWIVNIGRSVPFIILIVAIIPLTRFITGSSIGNNAAIVSLVVAGAPFIARQVESSLEEIDFGVIEAAISMGASNFQIMYKVMLPEAIPSLIRGLSIAMITILSYTAMAGAVGAGGLGKIAITYGYHRYQSDVLIATIIVLVVLVQLIQGILALVAYKIDKTK